jgi:hypothetical protein
LAGDGFVTTEIEEVLAAVDSLGDVPLAIAVSA